MGFFGSIVFNVERLYPYTEWTSVITKDEGGGHVGGPCTGFVPVDLRRHPESNHENHLKEKNPSRLSHSHQDSTGATITQFFKPYTVFFSFCR